jgi:DNA polymerase-3 subunit beta
MQFSVDHTDLCRAIVTVARAVPSRTTLPVLTGILLETGEDRLTLTATDLDLGIRTATAAQVTAAGAVVLPARYLNEIVRRIPGGELTFRSEGDDPTVHLAWRRSRFTIQGFAADQFPPFPTFPGQAATFVPNRLADAVRHTVFAASTDAARPVLTGVELFVDADEFRALATDGTRVAHHCSRVDREDWSAAQRLLVPARGLAEALRILDGDEQGSLAVLDNHLLLDLTDTRLAIRLLDGRYPAVLELLPKSYPTVARLSRQDLYDACERVSLIADAAERLYAVTLSTGTDRVRLTAQSPEVGRAEEEIEARVEGPELVVGFNARMLLDGLRHADGEQVLLELSGPLTAARLRRPDDESFVYLQMPVRIG